MSYAGALVIDTFDTGGGVLAIEAGGAVLPHAAKAAAAAAVPSTFLRVSVWGEEFIDLAQQRIFRGVGVSKVR
jgi:hypothetical protein